MLFAYNPANPPTEILVAAHLWCVFWIVLILSCLFGGLWICWKTFCIMVGWTDDEYPPQAR